MKEPSTGGSRKGPPPIIFVLLGISASWLLSTQLSKLLRSRPSLPAIPAGASLPGADGAVGGMFLGVRDFAQRFPRQASLAAGTTISIDGSTSMVLINQALKTSFPSTYPGTVVNTAATGSDNGIQALLGGSVNLAAISRPLTAAERSQALAIPRALQHAAEAYAEGQRDGGVIAEIGRNDLDGVALEYLELRSTDLGLYDPELPAVLLVAGHVGTTRLIDNIVFDPTTPEHAATQFSTKEFA